MPRSLAPAIALKQTTSADWLVRLKVVLRLVRQQGLRAGPRRASPPPDNAGNSGCDDAKPTDRNPSWTASCQEALWDRGREYGEVRLTHRIVTQPISDVDTNREDSLALGRALESPSRRHAPFGGPSPVVMDRIRSAVGFGTEIHQRTDHGLFRQDANRANAQI